MSADSFSAFLGSKSRTDHCASLPPSPPTAWTRSSRREVADHPREVVAGHEVFGLAFGGEIKMLEKGEGFLRPELFIGETEGKPVVEPGSCSYLKSPLFCIFLR